MHTSRQLTFVAQGNRNIPHPHPKQSGNAFIGYLLIAYAFFTLALTFYLSALPKTTLAAKNQRPDFASIKDLQNKKETFFQYLLPAIQAENSRMNDAQQRLKTMRAIIEAGQSLSQSQQQGIRLWTEQYRVDSTLASDEKINRLLSRMDQIPASMVLAQGAMESAWGTSRFARHANNYFGQWCFSQGCGLKPSQRNAGASHEVAKFADADAAVASYFKNINRHPAYQRVRDERTSLRQAEQPLDSMVMVLGLGKYSAKGQAYIEELQSMIRYNTIKRFD